MALEHFVGDEHDDELWLRVKGNLVDLSSLYTLSAKVVDVNMTTVLSKSTGFTGAAGSGVEATGTPNLTIAWATSAELSTVTPGDYTLQVQARRISDSKDLIWQLPFRMRQSGS